MLVAQQQRVAARKNDFGNACISSNRVQCLLVVSRAMLLIRKFTAKTVATVDCASWGRNEQHAPVIFLQQARRFYKAAVGVGLCKRVANKAGFGLLFP